MSLTPAPGYVLVKLTKKYQSNLSAEQEKYEQHSSGVAMKMFIATEMRENDPNATKTYLNALGKTVYFEPFQEGVPIKEGDDEYVFLPVTQIRGFDNA